MEAICFFETLVSTYMSARRHNPGVYNSRCYPREKLKYHTHSRYHTLPWNKPAWKGLNHLGLWSFVEPWLQLLTWIILMARAAFSKQGRQSTGVVRRQCLQEWHMSLQSTCWKQMHTFLGGLTTLSQLHRLHTVQTNATWLSKHVLSTRTCHT
jgi:hypothetical protein